VCSRLKFLGANGDVAKSRRPLLPPFSRQKSATNGHEAGSRVKKQGQPNPLAQPTPCACWPGGGGGLVLGKVVGANGDVAQSRPLLLPPFSRQKRVTNGQLELRAPRLPPCSPLLSPKKQARPTPWLQPPLCCGFRGLWWEVVCLWRRYFVQMVVWRKAGHQQQARGWLALLLRRVSQPRAHWSRFYADAKVAVRCIKANVDQWA
jgi:hypothetical protein